MRAIKCGLIGFITIEIILLSMYSSEQQRMDVMYYSVNVVPNTYSTVECNGCMLVTSLLILAYLHKKKQYDSIGANSTPGKEICHIVTIVSFIGFGIIFALLSFIAHCTGISCFHIETPLYIIALIITILLLFIFAFLLVASIVMCMQILYKVCKQNSIQVMPELVVISIVSETRVADDETNNTTTVIIIAEKPTQIVIDAS